MKQDEMIAELSDRAFLDHLYGWCYKRCSTTPDAEDLCQSILLNILAAIRADREIVSFHAFCWSVADHVYADFCEKRKKRDSTLSTAEDEQNLRQDGENPIEDWMDRAEDQANLKKILRSITYLARIYREVTVMYYLDQLRIADIARKLQISVSAVKQRLYFARKTIQREVLNMEKVKKPIALENMDFTIWGTGNPAGNDPRNVSQRQFSRHLIWLCKEKPRTPSELSELTGVPTVYVEEELEIQVRGENGQYGMLRKLDDGRYALNIVLLDQAETKAVQSVYQKYMPEIREKMVSYFEENKDRLLSFPYLNRKTTLNLILWQQFRNACDSLSTAVDRKVNAHYSNVERPGRPFSVFGFTPIDTAPLGFGCDGISAHGIDGYETVFLSNMYCFGLLAPHFHCEHNIANDGEIRLAVRALNGIPVADLSEREKEIAAKAIEHGWVYREDEKLYTKILTVDAKDQEAYHTQVDLSDRLGEVADKVAADLIALIDRILPEHLKGEYGFISKIAGLPVEMMLVDALMDCGLMTLPEGELGAEGVLMILTK